MSTQEISTLVTQLVTATRDSRRRPSRRNLEVYQQIRVLGESQMDTAVQFGLTQQRVSAICRQVERWIGEHGEEGGGAGRLRNERWLARRRIEVVYDWSLKGLRMSGETLETVVTRMKGDETHERQLVHKQQALNPRWARLAKQSAEKLLDIAEASDGDGVAVGGVADHGEAGRAGGGSLRDSQPPAGRRLAQAERVIRLVAGLRRLIRQEGVQACLPQVVEQVLRACLEKQETPEELPDSGGAAALALPRETNPPVIAAELPADGNGCNCCEPGGGEKGDGGFGDGEIADASESLKATCDEASMEVAIAAPPDDGDLDSENTTVSPPPNPRLYRVPRTPLTVGEQAALRVMGHELGMAVTAELATALLNEFASSPAAPGPQFEFGDALEATFRVWAMLLEAREGAP